MTAKRTEFKTKGEARVAIAKDVLKWMNTKKLHASSCNGYVTSGDGNLFNDEDVEKNADVKKNLKGKKCEVCALGAVFLTTVDRFNKIGCRDLVGADLMNPWTENRSRRSLDREEITGYLKSYFTRLQLCMIESAYETSEFDTDENTFEGTQSWAKIAKASKYGEDFRLAGVGPEGRLRRIMSNIIDNKGTFKP